MRCVPHLTLAVWLGVSLTLFGCAGTGPPYFITVCNLTPRPIAYTLVASAVQSGEDSLRSRTVAIEPGSSALGRFGFVSAYRPAQIRQPSVPDEVGSFQFEAESGARLVVTPEDLLAREDWWKSPGWMFAVVERDGALEAASCS